VAVASAGLKAHLEGVEREVGAQRGGGLPRPPAAASLRSRVGDLHVTIAAALTAHALNVGYTPVISSAPALTRARISHVDQNYLRAVT